MSGTHAGRHRKAFRRKPPCAVRTEFTRKAGGTFAKIFRPIMRSPEFAARTLVYLATAPEVGRR